MSCQPNEICNRWWEHSDDILNRPSQVQNEFIRSLSCSPIKILLLEPFFMKRLKWLLANSKMENLLAWMVCMQRFKNVFKMFKSELDAIYDLFIAEDLDIKT